MIPGEAPGHAPGARDGLRPLTGGDIHRVVDLHVRLFGSPSSRRYLTRAFYPTMLHASSTGAGYVQVVDGEIVAFIVGALDTSAWHRTLVRARGLECALAAVRMGIGRWREFQEAAGQLRSLLSRMSRRTGALIFFLGVEETHRGRGLARSLVDAFLDRCRTQRLSHCWTRTQKTNATAQALYLRAGFRLDPTQADTRDTRVYCVRDLHAP